MGSITLNYTTVDDAESKDTWTTIGDASNLDDGSYPPRQGNQCVIFGLAPDKVGGIKSKEANPHYDARVYETGLWFLNPAVDKDGNNMIKNSASALRLRLYSGDEWADFYQTQHRRADGYWNGGWLYLRASGDVNDADKTSDGWDESCVANITNVAVIVEEGPGDSTDKDSGEYGVDWAKFYDKIIIDGDNDGNPWTIEDIVAIDEDIDSGGGMWGISSYAGGFLILNAGIEVTGSFKLVNGAISIKQWSDIQKQNIVIKNGGIFQLGDYVNGYYKNGAIIDAKGRPNIIVEDGGIFKIYDSKIMNFGTISLGSDQCEIVKSDLYNNSSIEITKSGIVINRTRMFFDPNNKGNLGFIDANVSNIEDIEIFNCANGIEIKNNCTIKRLRAVNNDTDIIVNNGVILSLVDSSYTTLKEI